MRRILFVDDEPRILQALERTFMTLDNEWDMEFVASGKEALEHLDARTTDVLITDMRMAGMDGAELLQQAANDYPTVVRLVLSGQASQDAVRRATPVAHRFISKPCRPDVLREVVERSCILHEQLHDGRLRELVDGTAAGAARPKMYVALEKALASPTVSASDIATIIGTDAAMSEQLLRHVNSSLVGLRQSITDVERAVAYVGAALLKNLVLSYEVYNLTTTASLSLDREYRHALTSAVIARSMFEDATSREAAYTGALLHDLGKVYLAQGQPEAFDRLRARALSEDRPSHEIESEESQGATHAEVGAYLLSSWGIPTPAVEAVAHHHAPWRIPARAFDLTAGVYAANILASEAGACADDSKRGGLDENFLESIGITEEQVTSWRLSAKRAADDDKA